MKVYLDLLRDVLENGVEKGDRTGTGTLSVFGRQIRINLQEGFPLLTTKRLHFKSIAHELFWMLNGGTNVKDLQKYGVSIWDEWADGNGELGPVYGKQWREWTKPPIHINKQDLNEKYVSWVPTSHSHAWAFFKPIDQMQNAIDTIKNNPNSRRILVSAWNPADTENMNLPPCHMMMQFYCQKLNNMERFALYLSKKNGIPRITQFENATGHDEFLHAEADKLNIPKYKLSCSMYQRSADIFLGVPYNIASYALLTNLMAHVTNLDVGELIISFGDLHIYKNHIEQVKLQLTREPKLLPRLWLDLDREKYANLKNLDIAFEEGEQIDIINYKADSSIKAEVAV